ncbi:MAG: hypothetical protein IPN83_00865 [Holophagales bacterium]|jgi:hypothetical protein|nr:hypothetical protein [Holophagales bacterium]
MTKTAGRLGLIALLFTGTSALSQQTTVYVPRFGVLTEHVTFPDPFQEGWRTWRSAVNVFNPTGTRGTVATAAVFGPDGEIPVVSGCAGTLTSVEPGAGRDFDGCPAPIDHVGFAALSIPEPFVVTAEVERTLGKSCRPEDQRSYFIGEGRAAMPVFRALFPAAARVLTGPVTLGTPGIPAQCGPSSLKGIRRVNVTMFNAGEEPALFKIRVLKLRRDSTPILEQEVTVGAKSVLQVNRLPIPLLPDPDMEYGEQLFVWITIEATQPYLAYVSSIFDDPEPGALAFEVFAPQRIQ